MRTYAIGDIHGHIDLLEDAHAKIARDRAKHGDFTAPVVHVGDLVDRGPDSRAVVEFLRAGVAARKPWIVLKGNHDRMFSGFLSDMNHQDPGLRHDLSYLHPRIGGAETLASYGVRSAADRPVAQVHADAVANVPAIHRTFLDIRPSWYRRGEVVFVHAGIRPGIPMERQSEDDLVWIRRDFLEDPRDHGFLVVHGHTAIHSATNYGNRVNIDSSAAYGGPLTTVVLEGRDVFVLEDGTRRPLPPVKRAG